MQLIYKIAELALSTSRSTQLAANVAEQLHVILIIPRHVLNGRHVPSAFVGCASQFVACCQTAVAFCFSITPL